MKVLLLSRYGPLGASSRLRTQQYLPDLEREGICVEVNTLFDDDYVRRLYGEERRSISHVIASYLVRCKALLQCSKYDVLWIEKELFPFLPAIAERVLSFFGKAYVVDYDDAIFHNYDQSSNFLVRTIMGNKIAVVMRGASTVIVGNDYLADYARKAGAGDIRVLPTVLDGKRYRGVDGKDGKRLVIGWIGSPSTQHFLKPVWRVLGAICSEYGASIRVIGATPDVLEYVPRTDCELRPWVEDDEPSEVADFDIGIMPLPDEPWARGKCGYKIVQYMASEVPVVASPVGVNVSLVGDNDCGYLAGTEEQWRLALVNLLQSPSQRLAMGKAGRVAVEKSLTLQAQLPALLDILRAADTRRTGGPS